MCPARLLSPMCTGSSPGARAPGFPLPLPRSPAGAPGGNVRCFSCCDRVLGEQTPVAAAAPHSETIALCGSAWRGAAQRPSQEKLPSKARDGAQMAGLPRGQRSPALSPPGLGAGMGTGWGSWEVPTHLCERDTQAPGAPMDLETCSGSWTTWASGSLLGPQRSCL